MRLQIYAILKYILNLGLDWLAKSIKISNKIKKDFLREIIYKVLADNLKFIDRKLEEEKMNWLSDKIWS